MSPPAVSEQPEVQLDIGPMPSASPSSAVASAATSSPVPSSLSLPAVPETTSAPSSAASRPPPTSPPDYASVAGQPFCVLAPSSFLIWITLDYLRFSGHASPDQLDHFRRYDHHIRSVLACSQLLPVPVNHFTKKRKSRATTSRLLTDSEHMNSVEGEQKDSKAKGHKEKRKKALKNTAKKAGTKKRTVRADKGRAPPLQKKPKKPKMGAVESRKTSADNLDNTPCAGCGKLFCESTENWLDCRACHSWFDLSCAAMLSKSKHEQDDFLCTECHY